MPAEISYPVRDQVLLLVKGVRRPGDNPSPSFTGTFASDEGNGDAGLWGLLGLLGLAGLLKKNKKEHVDHTRTTGTTGTNGASDINRPGH